MIPLKRFDIFPPDWGVLRRSRSVQIFRSVNNIVIPPAKTGSDSRSKNAVIKTDQTNKGKRCILIPGARILKIVVIKLMAPKIEAAPER